MEGPQYGSVPVAFPNYTTPNRVVVSTLKTQRHVVIPVFASVAHKKTSQASPAYLFDRGRPANLRKE